MKTLRAPFPYFGFKGKIAPEIWKRLGDVPNYVEPFFGSGAVLLQRPGGAGKREVCNDKYGFVCNFWRAVKANPEGIVDHAVTLNCESDLHARNGFIRPRLDELTSRLEGHPEFFDVQLAGYWVYVQSMAIGEAAFAKGPWIQHEGKLVKAKDVVHGIRRAVPCDASRGIQKSIPFHGKQGIMSRSDFVFDWLVMLHDRMKDVRVLCGDWVLL